MSLSESASAQVQAILQAAETSAAAIKREAEEQAEHIRSTARESKQEDLSGVLAMVAKMREDLDALTAKLNALSAADEAPVAPPETAKTTRAPKAAPAPPKEADPDADVEGARLIALNMALNGESREATDKYLADNFELGDRSGLLDEVYASVEG